MKKEAVGRLCALLTRQALPLFDLTDADGRPPEFLNPRADRVEEGIDTIRSTPPRHGVCAVGG